jgi:dephospho-CoA kinase
MLRVGLTGGIACGKSTVAGMFRDLGYPVLDADLIAHQLLEKGQPAHDQVLDELLGQVPKATNPDGSINRTTLGNLVFADQAKLAQLNAILHPIIEKKIVEWFAALARHAGTPSPTSPPNRTPPFAIAEAALLVEAGYKKRLDRLIVVHCRKDQQLERMAARGLTETAALLRLDAQMNPEEKLQAADDVIDTSGAIPQTRLQVQDLAEKLSRLATATPQPGSNVRR